MPDPAIKVLPTLFREVLELLRSDALRAVERPVAAAVGLAHLDDESTSHVSGVQANLSVSGLTVAQAEALLTSNRDQLVAFGIAFLGDAAAMDDTEEYPEGEEQDPAEASTVIGLPTGFGVTHAIYYNFLANRTPPEFRAYLKNRRIPHQAKFARELRRVFDATRPRPE